MLANGSVSKNWSTCEKYYSSSVSATNTCLENLSFICLFALSYLCLCLDSFLGLFWRNYGKLTRLFRSKTSHRMPGACTEASQVGLYVWNKPDISVCTSRSVCVCVRAYCAQIVGTDTQYERILICNSFLAHSHKTICNCMYNKFHARITFLGILIIRLFEFLYRCFHHSSSPPFLVCSLLWYYTCSHKHMHTDSHWPAIHAHDSN